MERLWRMVAEPAEQRVLRMAAKLGIRAETVAEKGRFLEPLLQRCSQCRSRITCTRWIVFGGGDAEMAEFCPNAELFSRLPRHERRVDASPAGGEAAALRKDQPGLNLQLPASLGYTVLCWAALAGLLVILLT
jgi:hypothetical protein